MTDETDNRYSLEQKATSIGDTGRYRYRKLLVWRGGTGMYEFICVGDTGIREYLLGVVFVWLEFLAVA